MRRATENEKRTAAGQAVLDRLGQLDVGEGMLFDRMEVFTSLAC